MPEIEKKSELNVTVKLNKQSLKTQIKGIIEKNPIYECKLNIINRVRRILNDFADKNAYFKAEQISDDFLMDALDLVVEDFNQTPPIKTNYTPCNFPQTDILLNGILARVFESLALTDARNSYPMQLGEIAVQSDKTDRYLQLANIYEAKYKQITAKWKAFLNIQNGYGGWWSW